MSEVQHPAKQNSGAPHGMWRHMLAYMLVRLVAFIILWVVIALLAMLIGAPVPLLMSAMLAIVVLFPLSFFLFPKLRAQVTSDLAQWGDHRRQQRQWVQQEIEGRD